MRIRNKKEGPQRFPLPAAGCRRPAAIPLSALLAFPLADKVGFDGMVDNLGTGFRGDSHSMRLIDIVVVVCVVAAAIALVWFLLRAYALWQERYRKQPRWLFDRLSKMHGLRWSERRLLWEVAQGAYPDNPVQLFVDPRSLQPPYGKFVRQVEMARLAAIAARLFAGLQAPAAKPVMTPLMPSSAGGIDVGVLLGSRD